MEKNKAAGDADDEPIRFALVIIITSANTTLLSCLPQAVCDGGLCGGGGGRCGLLGYKEKDSLQDRNSRAPAGLSELEGHFSPFVCMAIDCEIVEYRHNSLQAGTDGPALLELTGSTNCASAFGANGSQMGGRTGAIELRVMQNHWVSMPKHFS